MNKTEKKEQKYNLATKEIILPKTLETGFKFSCQFCGECCRGFEEGEVYLYLEDIKRLAKYCKQGLGEFAKEYLTIVEDNFYWKEPGALRGKKYRIPLLGFKFIGDDEHCEFLGDDNLCTIYEIAPFQCHCYPWWRIHLKHPSKLREYAKKCPGLKASFNNQGEYISPKKILGWAKKEYKMEVNYFLKLRANDFDIAKVYPFLPLEMVEEYLKKKENQ